MEPIADKIREQVGNMNILVEDWGGKVPMPRSLAQKGPECE